MRYLQMAALLFLVGIICTGCFYSNIRTPLDTNLDRTELGKLTGEAELHSFLWLVAWGDAGTAAAAKQGGLTRINHMDTEVLSVLMGLYYRQKVIVYGD